MFGQQQNTKNSDYFRLLKNVIVFSGFNSLWYNAESWRGRMIQFHCKMAAFIFFSKMIFLNQFSVEVFRKDLMENWREIALNLASILTVDITIQKFFIFRAAAMQKLFREAFEQDRWAMKTQHEGIRKALKPLRDEVYRISVVMLVIFICCFFILYGFSSYIYTVGKECDLSDENRECVRILPWATLNFLYFENWYGSLVILHTIGMSYIQFYIVAANIAKFALCVFPTFRLRHMNHVLENFDYYGKLLSEKEKISINAGEYYVVRECIIEHQKIISDFADLKSNTRVLFFMDFLTMAVQIAPYPVIIMGTEQVDHIYFFAIEFLFFSFYDLLMTYWFAHYIVQESEAVQLSACTSKWHLADIRTKKLLLMMMIRSQKRLALQVGSLYEMDLNIFLRIVKGMYTMMTVFRQRTVEL